MIPDLQYNPPPGDPVILYEDEQIIVAEKPAGLLSVPGKRADRDDCMVSRLQAMRWDALLVHRLDCDTSGLMIFGRTKAAQGFLGQEFEQRRAKKTYVARVVGRIAEDSGRVDLPLGADWPNRPRQMVDHENGRPAVTDWEVTHRSDTETRLRLSPITGRSHQLRVHLLALGHPILGDQIYARETLADHARLMLHAETLGLHHPASGDWITFTSPVPF